MFVGMEDFFQGNLEFRYIGERDFERLKNVRQQVS
jgi:hypothetical protein